MGTTASGPCSQLRAGCPEPLGAPCAALVPIDSVLNENTPGHDNRSSSSWRPAAAVQEAAVNDSIDEFGGDVLSDKAQEVTVKPIPDLKFVEASQAQVLEGDRGFVNDVTEVQDWTLKVALDRAAQETPRKSPRHRANADVISVDKKYEVGASLLAKDMRSAAGFELLRAASTGDVSGVSAALATGAPVDFVSAASAGKTALLVAVENGFIDASRILIESGASLLVTDPHTGLSTVMIAAARGDMDGLAEYMIQEGAPLDAADKTGGNVLFHCCTGALVRWMCERRADPNSARADGVTPLLSAAEIGNSQRCQLLLQCGASANLTDQNGRSALEHSLLNKDEALSLLLLEGGAKPSLWELSMEPFSKAVSAMLRKAPQRRKSQEPRKQPSQAMEWRTWKQSPRRRGHSTPRQYASDEYNEESAINLPNENGMSDTD